ncbi:MAG: AEC family transporter [Nisaea sp.]|uniref:AEC family transporter n=1 Tax=Nisaea sp. TaxID=2024842 RepID=UPI001B2283C3|nr:AEC family transporter [Nisaea sp.]MBO6562652.1 AEC family transporter [Nisaea sp.]
MEILIDIVLPVFGTVFIAYGAARLGWFPEAAVDNLSKFVFNFAIPPMLFHTMARQTLPDPIEWEFLISFFGAGYAVWLLGMLISLWWFRRDFAHASLAGMTGAFGNTVMLGIPLILTTFGDAGTLPVFLIIAFHSWQFFAVITILVEGSRGQKGTLVGIPWAIVKSLLTNPLLIGLLCGLAWNIFSLPLPKPLEEITGFMGRAALPCAVFAMGASLARYRLRGAIWEALVGSALKLVAFPALTYILATHVFSMEPLWRDVAVIVAALPVGVNVYLFADRYNSGTPAAATSILVSTFLSFGTVAFVLHFLGVR